MKYLKGISYQWNKYREDEDERGLVDAAEGGEDDLEAKNYRCRASSI